MKSQHRLLGLVCASTLVAAPGMAAPATPLNATLLLIAAVGRPNPAKFNYEHFYDSAAALESAAMAIGDEATGELDRIRQVDLTLMSAIRQAAEANAEEASDGRLVVDSEGFAKSMAGSLRREKALLVPYAAIGWGISEKAAGKQFDGLTKSPEYTAAIDFVIAVLSGSGEEMKKLTIKGDASQDKLEAQQLAHEAAHVLQN